MNTDSLTQLRDIHTPDAIGWWPLAPACYIIAALGIFSLLVLLYTLLKIIHRRKKYKQLNKMLADITLRYHVTSNKAETIAELAVFLRRLVITYYPEHAAASGQAWLQTLANITGNVEYTQGIGQLLISAPYQKDVPKESAKLFELVSKTMKQITQRKRRHG